MNALLISAMQCIHVHFKAKSGDEDGCDVNRIPSEKRVVDSVRNLTIISVGT